MGQDRSERLPARSIPCSCKWPRTTTKLVENKANGPAIVSTLRTEIPGLVEVEPDGGKEARANAVTPFVEAGNVYLPHPQVAPWVAELIDELAAFPTGRHDDQVDALSQALGRLMKRGGAGTVTSTPYVLVGDDDRFNRYDDDDDLWPRYGR